MRLDTGIHTAAYHHREALSTRVLPAQIPGQCGATYQELAEWMQRAMLAAKKESRAKRICEHSSVKRS
jgi:hypothetical protein